MSTLVIFEDEYGVCDIATYTFFNKFIEKGVKEKIIDGVHIRRALTSGNVFNIESLEKGIANIVIVYDMDKQTQSNEYNILNVEELIDKIGRLDKLVENYSFRFIPTIFAAETICLHMLQPYGIDFSNIFSSKNTAHLHTKILSDMLSDVHSDKLDNTFWRRHGKDNFTFKVKQTRNFISDFNELREVVEKLNKSKFSIYNKTLFEWLLGGNIEDISRLLTVEEAIKLQEKIVNDYKEFLRNGDKVISINGIEYRTDINYKD